MVHTWEYIVITLVVLCAYHTSINCSPISNKTLTSSESSNTAPQFRSKSIEAAENTLIVKVGHAIRIYCGVMGTPKPEVLLYKGDKLLERPSDFSEPWRLKFEHNTFRISPAKKTDAGTYICVAVNRNANTSLQYDVKVIEDDPKDSAVIDDNASRISGPDTTGEYKPYWTRPERMQKQLHAEPAGNTVKFQCRVEGKPTPNVTWYKNKELINKNDRLSGYKIKNNGQLIILETVVLSDNGMYMCKAANKLGSINHTYELDVQERAASRPLLQFEPPYNRTAFVGEDVTFTCKVFSDPHPHVKWVRHIQVNGSWVNPKTGESYFKLLKESGIDVTDLEHLYLQNVTKEDSGKYTCIATNYIGQQNFSGRLEVIEVPPPTQAPTTRRGVEASSSPEVTKMVYGLVAVLITLVLIGVLLFLYSNHRHGKDPPMLVPIKDPENIPQMTKVEIPTMMYGNSEAWRRMCLPAQDQFEFNIPPDLQWELRREDIVLTERLDEGFFGQVFKADLLTPNARNEVVVCAVKMLKASRTEKDVLDLLSEMDQMKRIGKHKNIINLLGVCTQNGPLMLVTEYASEGNLREFLRRNRPQNMHCNLVLPSDMHTTPPENMPMQDTLLSQRDLVAFAYQVSRGMDYLAQKKCIHRDLAARNVLVTEDRVMKIADFGLARDIRSCDYYRKHTRGHLPYKWMALEAMADNVFTHATDVWSYGVLLWEIFSLAATPYPGIKTGELVKFLRSGERLEKPQFATQEMYMLMRDCWEEEPRRRPIFRSLVEDLEKMLSEASNDEFISGYDAMADYVDSADSEETDDDDDVFEQTENSDSMSGRNTPFNEERDSFASDPYAAPLLGNTDDHSNIMHNQHARLQSDV